MEGSLNVGDFIFNQAAHQGCDRVVVGVVLGWEQGGYKETTENVEKNAGGVEGEVVVTGCHCELDELESCGS